MLLEKELIKVKSYTTFWWISCHSFGVIFNRVDENLDLCYDFYLVVVLCFLFTVRMQMHPPSCCAMDDYKHDSLWYYELNLLPLPSVSWLKLTRLMLIKKY